MTTVSLSTLRTPLNDQELTAGPPVTRQSIDKVWSGQQSAMRSFVKQLDLSREKFWTPAGVPLYAEDPACARLITLDFLRQRGTNLAQGRSVAEPSAARNALAQCAPTLSALGAIAWASAYVAGRFASPDAAQPIALGGLIIAGAFVGRAYIRAVNDRYKLDDVTDRVAQLSDQAYRELRDTCGDIVG